jgi:hypothetical protein
MARTEGGILDAKMAVKAHSHTLSALVNSFFKKTSGGLVYEIAGCFQCQAMP